MNITDAIEAFRRSGATIIALTGNISDAQAHWKPAPETWSVLEVVRHLADEERDDFRTRLDYILHRPRENWPPIDPEGVVMSRRYNEGVLDAAVEDFAQERDRSLQWLASLGEPDLDVEHVHAQFGSMSAGSMLTSWVAHDLLHIRQLAKLHYQYLLSNAAPYTADYAGPTL